MKKIGIIISVITILLVVAALAGCLQTQKKPEEIKIGAIFALTGAYGPFGERAQKGAELALEEINSEGINGSKVKIIYEDSQGESQKAVSAFQKLTELDKVNFILGPLSSAETLAIAPQAENKKTIILTPVSSAPQITTAGDYIFRNVVSDVFEGTVAADFVIKNLQKKKAGIFYLNNEYGLGIKDVFNKRFNNLGGETIIEDTFNAGDTDFRTQLSRINQNKPDVVILVGYAVEMGQILKQAKELGIKSQFVSFSPFEAPEILAVAKEGAEGVYYIYQGFDTKSDEVLVKRFVDKYKSKYNEEPDIFAALTYDAVKIYAEAFKKGGSNVEDVKKALYGIKDFNGVVGKTSFDENGDVIKPLGIKKVENGKFIWIERNFEVKLD